MKELIDQIDLIALPLSYHLISPSILYLVQNRTEQMCVRIMVDSGILFYFISIIIVKSRRLERAQGPF
jgi:hypothetical protein